MTKEILLWIEKMSNEFAQCECGKMCHINLTIRHHFVELSTICIDCEKTVKVMEPIYLVKEANIDLIDAMIKSLKHKFNRYLKCEVAE